MAMAILHVICGNCGCDDKFEYRIDLDEDCGNKVYIYCNNCSTIHNLDDNADTKKPP